MKAYRHEPLPPPRKLGAKGYLVFLAVVLGILWLSSGLRNYIPGQEEHPELAKARLCSVAEVTHKAFLDDAREEGIVEEAGITSEGVYTLEVDEPRWAEFDLEAQEVLAIAAWCQVTTPDGEGVSRVIGAESGEELASVVNGAYSVRGEPVL